MCFNSPLQIFPKIGLGNIDYVLIIIYSYKVNSISIESPNNLYLKF